MSPMTVRPSIDGLLAAFEAAARTASEAEAALRKEMEAQILRLDRRRAFAYRKLNFMRSLSESVRSAADEEAAVAAGRTKVRSQLGWESDSEARSETLSRLTPVTQATFCCLTSAEAELSAGEVVKALSDFEAWYEARFERAFWTLFEQHVEELPLVER